ncbi:MAG: ACP S-malonyltransferase [Phycisphaerales bacterium]
MSDSSDRSIVVVCPGQGAQAVGMGRAWATNSPEAKAVFDEADAILGDRLGATLSSLCFDGPAERLDRTDASQPAIFTASVAAWRGLQSATAEHGGLAGQAMVATAGLSLGEYTALHLAGVFDFATGLRLVAERGRLMQAAADEVGGGMVALIGATDAEAESVAADAAEGEVLVPANYNAPGQVVLSGAATACDRAAALAQERGFRATVLTVAGAFHSPLMQPAADRMAEAMSDIDFADPAVPVWSNVTAEPHVAGNVELLRQRLVEQITHPVRWSQSCVDLPSGEAIDYHEVAPGAVLRGLMRRIDRSRKVASHDEPDSKLSPRTTPA